MYPRSARNSAAAATNSRPGRASAAHSRTYVSECWRKFVTSSSATPDGGLLVDKAEGMTSHDVVALVRRRLEIKKGGHKLAAGARIRGTLADVRERVLEEVCDIVK